MIEEGWRALADELGPSKVVLLREPSSGLEGVVVVDNVAVGPAIGGLRLAPTVTVTEVFRLARAMTLKNAAAGLPHGGAKAGIIASATDAAHRERLVRAFAREIVDLTDYIPGPDIGTNETAMAWVRDEIGRAVGLPAVLGGIPLDVLGATGFGLAAAADVADDLGIIDLDGARVAIQGFGSVGRAASRFLEERGAVTVAVADSKAAVAAAGGMAAVELIAHKAATGSVGGFGGSTPLTHDELVAVDCDIWVPAAGPDVITADNAGSVEARLILEGANIPATLDAERMLHERGVIVVPDFIANAGGVICAAVEHRGGTAAGAFAEITERVSANVREVLESAMRDGVPPREAAEAIARARVVEAVSYRRTFA